MSVSRARAPFQMLCDCAAPFLRERLCPRPPELLCLRHRGSYQLGKAPVRIAEARSESHVDFLRFGSFSTRPPRRSAPAFAISGRAISPKRHPELEFACVNLAGGVFLQDFISREVACLLDKGRAVPEWAILY
jgi:hypothetical protein